MACACGAGLGTVAPMLTALWKKAAPWDPAGSCDGEAGPDGDAGTTLEEPEFLGKAGTGCCGKSSKPLLSSSVFTTIIPLLPGRAPSSLLSGVLLCLVGWNPAATTTCPGAPSGSKEASRLTSSSTVPGKKRLRAESFLPPEVVDGDDTSWSNLVAVLRGVTLMTHVGVGGRSSKLLDSVTAFLDVTLTTRVGVGGRCSFSFSVRLWLLDFSAARLGVATTRRVGVTGLSSSSSPVHCGPSNEASNIPLGELSDSTRLV